MQQYLFYRTRINHKDPRFRRDQQYLFSCLSLKDLKAIDAGCYATVNLRCPGETPFTAKQLVNGIMKDDGEVNRRLNTLMGSASVRGTAEYWFHRKGDLQAMIEHFGPATFFLTLSCAEYYWDDMKEFLWLRNSDIPNVEARSVPSLALLDPVSVASHFRTRVDVYFKEVILKENGPLGEVLYYFIRIEYQARGAPHAHIIIWIKRAPVIGKSSPESIIKFIDEHITCRLPESDSELGQMVRRFQVHSKKHTKSCLRTSSKRGSFCRFGLPRPSKEKTTLNTLQESFESRRRPSSSSGTQKLYDLKGHQMRKWSMTTTLLLRYHGKPIPTYSMLEKKRVH